MKRSGVYIITCIINNKSLVGESSDIDKRLMYHKQNLKRNRHENPYLQNAWNKYGEENFTFSHLGYCEPSLTKKLENEWCKILSTHDKSKGYNIRGTSDDGKAEMSEETKRKLSESLSKSEKFKNRDSGKGMRGKKHSTETKKKMSLKRKDFKHSKESLIKLSKSLKGRRISPESTAKRVETRKKNGYRHSEETKRKISEANKGRVHKNYIYRERRNSKSVKCIQYATRMSKRVLQIDRVTGIIIKEWESASAAARALGISQGTISNCCRKHKHCKSYKGFIWKYKN